MSDSSSVEGSRRKRKHSEANSSSSLKSNNIQSTLDRFTVTRISTPQNEPFNVTLSQETDNTPLPPPERAMNFTDSVRDGPAPQKKLVIKGFKVKPKLPETFEEDTWAKLHRAIIAIHEQSALPNSLEELYRACENMCSHKMGESLYKRLYATLEKHMQAVHQRLLPSNSDDFLKRVNEEWLLHCRQFIDVRNIFLYLDRTYLRPQNNLPSLWDTGLNLLRDQVIKKPDILPRLLDGILSEIQKDRMGDVVSRETLRSLLRMFLELGLYHGEFEKLFLDQTKEFYTHEGLSKTSDMEGQDGDAVATYLKYAEERIKEEQERCMLGLGYIDETTRTPLIQTVENALVRQHVPLLISSGFNDLIKDDRKEDLKRVYVLFSRVNGLDPLKQAFSDYIQSHGLTLVMDPQRDANMVQDLLSFKSTLDDIVSTSFQKSESFGNALKESFEKFINQRQNKPGEMIAKHVDALLRQGKGVSEDEVDAMLDKCMTLFRFIQGKDVFEAFYKKDLAKRLLVGKSASVDAEKSMLTKLKQECGSGFTTKLEGMFKDMDVSKDIMAAFKSSRQGEDLQIDFNVNVLTQGFWPTYIPVEINLPQDMQVCLENFKEFYLSKHSGRNLHWQHTLAHCTLKANFPKGNKELVLSLFQTLVMLLFNQEERLSFVDISKATGIPNDELKKTLQSLACGKVRVLTKHPKGRDVDDTDEFTVNNDFENPLFRVKVNTIQIKETVQEQAATSEKVVQDRQYQIDAAIVRIMKMRKTISHNSLVQELVEQLRFAIKPVDLKKRIESLIERSYMERSTEDSR